MKFKANWISRSPRVLVISPKVTLEALVVGALKCGVFVKLKNSARNSRLKRSLMGNSFWTERSY